MTLRLYKQYMIDKKSLKTTGSEYSSYLDNEYSQQGNLHGELSNAKFPNPNTMFIKIHLTQAPKIASHWKAIQLESFIHLSIEKPPWLPGSIEPLCELALEETAVSESCPISPRIKHLPRGFGEKVCCWRSLTIKVKNELFKERNRTLFILPSRIMVALLVSQEKRDNWR